MCAIAFACCFLTLPAVCADFVNPSFELYDPNGGPGFDTAIGWKVAEYLPGLHTFAADVNCLMPKIEYTGPGHGNLSGWPVEIVDNGLSPIDGKRLLMLSTGHIGGFNTTDRATAWQHISTQVGDRIRGYYFFGTAERTSLFDDFATITLVDTSEDPNDIEIIFVNVSYVGSNSSFDGWKSFEYVFNSKTAGEYDLTFHVEDIQDNKVNTYLGIDDLQYCPAPVSYGDIDGDCQCNNSDFAILSEYWLYDCTDPNNATIPPGPGECSAWLDSGSAGDIDKNDIVDISDLRIMSSAWLGVQ
jgi:hypothetical protein